MKQAAPTIVSEQLGGSGCVGSMQSPLSSYITKTRIGVPLLSRLTPYLAAGASSLRYALRAAKKYAVWGTRNTNAAVIP